MKLEIKKAGYMVQDRATKKDRWHDCPESTRKTKTKVIRDWDNSSLNRGNYRKNQAWGFMRLIPVYKLFYAGDNEPISCTRITLTIPAGEEGAEDA